MDRLKSLISALNESLLSKGGKCKVALNISNHLSTFRRKKADPQEISGP